MTVWTVGHSTHSLDVFVELLTVHEIALLVDVRTAAGGGRNTPRAAEARANTHTKRAGTETR